MKKQYASKTSLFLIELIISIFFFSVASAICLQIFVKSHLISEDTVNTNHAILWTQNLAEIFLGNHGDFKALKTLYSPDDCIEFTAFDKENNLLLLFDKSWQPVSDINTACYLILASYSCDQDFSYESILIAKSPAGLEYISVSLSDFTSDIKQQNLEIYSMQVKKYNAKGNHTDGEKSGI